MAKMVDCSELSKAIADAVFNLASRPDIKDIDGAVTEMQKVIPEISRGSVIEAINEVTRGQKKKISDIQKKIQDIKQEARSEKNIKNRIAQIEKQLSDWQNNKPIPKDKHPVPRAIKLLQELRDDLQKQLLQSPEAKKERLQKSIDNLIIKLNTRDYAPPKKRDFASGDKEIEKMRYRQYRLRQEINRRIKSMEKKNIPGKMMDVLNVPKAIITSLDMSAVLRQGKFIVAGHPVRAARGMKSMFQAFASPAKAHQIDMDIHSRPNAPLYQRARLGLTQEGAGLSNMEEGYMTRLADKIPLVSASARAYQTFLNKLRADSFDIMVENLAKNGEPTQKEIEAIANYINAATGRGSLGHLDKAAAGLNTIFFSPRYFISRVQLLMGQPVYGGSARTRKMIIKEYGRFLSGMSIVYLLGLLLGADVETDPRSSDFGKLRFGNTRLDVLAGLGQTAVLASRLITGKTKSITSGEISNIRGEKKYGREDAYDVLARFARTKLSPSVGAMVDVASGENIVGEKTTPVNTATRLFLPLSLRDIYEAVKEQGIPKGMAMAVVSIFGDSLQTFKPREKSKNSKKTKQKGTRTLPKRTR